MKVSEQEKPIEEEKCDMSAVLAERLAKLEEPERRQVLGFAQGLTYAKIQRVDAEVDR